MSVENRIALLFCFWAAGAAAQTAAIDALYPEMDALYLDLHKTPELSRHEVKTAAKMAERLRKLGFEVATGVGGTGVVGVLRNGSGPTVALRTELDALPVEEKTGLVYASTVTAVDDGGKQVHVMHACGHDVHMTSWVAAATLGRSRNLRKKRAAPHSSSIMNVGSRRSSIKLPRNYEANTVWDTYR